MIKFLFCDQKLEQGKLSGDYAAFCLEPVAADLKGQTDLSLQPKDLKQ